MKYFLAIDIGASSGRHIIGYEDKNKEITLDEVYRLPNHMDEVDGRLVWDLKRLFNEVKEGIKIAFEKYPKIESLSIDTWGVDYVLLDKNHQEILPAYAYRDPLKIPFSKKVHEIVPFEEIYKRTGIQYLPFNSIYQLYYDKVNGRLDRAIEFLMMPEYLAFKLTAKIKHEYTNATTGAIVSVATQNYDTELLDKLGIPRRLFKDLSYPGEELGVLTDDVAKEVGGNTMVVLSPSHDTASAYEALNVNYQTAILSSGTWSLLGIKNKTAIINEKAFNSNLTNEGGVGYYRFLKNIIGLWFNVNLHKETLKTYIELEKESLLSHYNEFFDVNDEAFMAPKSMKEAIKKWFEDRKITPPLTDGDYARTIYRSLAYKYKNSVDEMEDITGQKFEEIAVIGGGAKNFALNQFMEEITERRINVIPIEATAIGNIKTQIRRYKK